MDDPSAKHVAAARKRLLDLAQLATRTEQAERKILALAEQFEAQAAADMGRLAPRVHLDPEAARRYQAATLERGRCQVIAGSARKHLGE